MGKLMDIEEQSSTRWFAATYVDDDGSRYDITWCTNHLPVCGYEDHELAMVEDGLGQDVLDTGDGGLKERIRQALNDTPDWVSLTVRLSPDELAVLHQLVQAIHSGGRASLEGTLEAGILSQLQAQLSTRDERE